MAEQFFMQTKWLFKHDKQGPSIIPDKIIAFDEVMDIVARMSSPELGKRYKACGSHWALSNAPVPDNIAIETNFPCKTIVPRLSGLANIDLGEIATYEFVEYLAHHQP